MKTGFHRTNATLQGDAKLNVFRNTNVHRPPVVTQENCNAAFVANSVAMCKIVININIYVSQRNSDRHSRHDVSYKNMSARFVASAK